MDHVSKNKRSAIMARVGRAHTTPELFVRKALFAAGYRYRLHIKGLPGSPDIVLRKLRMAIFVHGCFWHGHNCRKGRRPKSNTLFWNTKLDRNIARDKKVQKTLNAMKWKVIVIWACSLEKQTQKALKILAARRRRRTNIASNPR